jgi:hypothetical protein
MTILGLGRVRVFLICNAFLGDQPQLNHMSGIFDSKALRACRFCIYPTQCIVPYDENIHMRRNVDTIIASLETVIVASAKKLLDNRGPKALLSKLKVKEDWVNHYNSIVDDALPPLPATMKAIKDTLYQYYGIDADNELIRAAQPTIDALRAECITAKPISPFLYMYMGPGVNILKGGSPVDSFHQLVAGNYYGFHHYPGDPVNLVSTLRTHFSIIKCNGNCYRNLKNPSPNPVLTCIVKSPVIQSLLYLCLYFMYFVYNYTRTLVVGFEITILTLTLTLIITITLT